jgi:UrcA family protein
MTSPMSKFTLKTLVTMIAAPVALTSLAPAAAAQDDPPRATVRYGDLDLTTAEGRELLKWRVHGAIARMCKTRASQGGPLRQQVDSMKCRAAARRSVEDRMAILLDGNGTHLAGGNVVAAR